MILLTCFQPCLEDILVWWLWLGGGGYQTRNRGAAWGAGEGGAWQDGESTGLVLLYSTHIEDTRYRRNLATSKLATAALNGLIATISTGLSKEQLVPSGYACRKCYMSLEKLKKSQATVDELTAVHARWLLATLECCLRC